MRPLIRLVRTGDFLFLEGNESVRISSRNTVVREQAICMIEPCVAVVLLFNFCSLEFDRVCPIGQLELSMFYALKELKGANFMGSVATSGKKKTIIQNPPAFQHSNRRVNKAI